MESAIELLNTTSVARDSEMRARGNASPSPASATLEESGRKSKRDAWKAKASGIQAKFGTECLASEANASLSVVAKDI